MSYEDQIQKRRLRSIEKSSAAAFHAGVSYGKALASFNQGYGRNRDSESKPHQIAIKRMPEVGKKLAAQTLAKMTGLQVRLAKRLPDNMAAQVADDQLVGDVFSLNDLEKII